MASASQTSTRPSGVDPVWWTPSQELGSNSAPAALHQFENHRREDELHSDVELSPWDHDGVGAAHEAQVDHREELGKIDAMRITDADGDHRFVERRDPARDERIGRVDRRRSLEVDVRVSELRTDVVDVVGHAAQDRRTSRNLAASRGYSTEAVTDKIATSDPCGRPDACPNGRDRGQSKSGPVPEVRARAIGLARPSEDRRGA